MRYLVVLLLTVSCIFFLYAFFNYLFERRIKRIEKAVHFTNPPFKVDTDWVPETVLADELQALRERHKGVISESYGIVCPICDTGDPCVVMRLINTVETAYARPQMILINKNCVNCGHGQDMHGGKCFYRTCSCLEFKELNGAD